MNTELEKYTIIKDEKLFQKAFLNFEEREVGPLTEEISIQSYIDKFDKFKTTVDEIFVKIDSQENKGSFLSHLENLKKEISTLEGVGNVEDLYIKISTVEIELHQQIRKNRDRNLAVKQAFIQELEVLLVQEDLSSVADRIKEIRSKWIRVGAAEKEMQEELNAKFEVLNNSFTEKYKEIISADLEMYNKLLEESENLKTSDDFKSAKSRIIEIQKEWKNLPNIPKNEFVPLFNKLREMHDVFFNRLKESFTKEKKEKNKVESEKGLKQKTQIITDAKELLAKIEKTQIKDLKTIQEQWKKSGRVNKDLGDKLWNEFSTICDQIFELKTLDILVLKFYRGDKNSESEILKFKIKQLRDSLKKEEQKLKTVENNLGNFRLNISSKKIENQFLSKDKNIEKKLELKKAILEDLKSELGKI